MDWNVLQECFRQQYSKFGSSREQYFHMWRSFTYDENTDTIDSYILKIKQVTSLLNYGEPEILELFKNTLPSKLYWILFPINNLREAVDTAKRVLNKEKLDKQLTCQASSTSPFMKVKDNTHSSQKVLIKPQDLETVTSMMYNMSFHKVRQRNCLSPRFTKKEEEVRNEVMIEIDLGITIDKDKVFHKIGTEMIIEGMCILKTLVEMMTGIEVEEVLTEVIVVTGAYQEKEVYPPEGTTITTVGKMAVPRFRSRSRSRSNSRISTNRDRIRCYKCMEYDHYANECPNVVTSNSEGHESDNAALQVMSTDTEPCDTHDVISYMEDTEYLNV